MSNFECTVTIADIYGAEWWERNKAELEREWEWGFGMDIRTNLIADKGSFTLQAANGHLPVGPRIILHRRKPVVPTLREVYGVDEVTIPQGWEWTGEWRGPVKGDCFYSGGMGHCSNVVNECVLGLVNKPRLILRERPKKVWFKAEEQPRVAYPMDWVWCPTNNAWVQWGAAWPSTSSYLCATRHEEVDSTMQVVTQAMVDGVGK